MGYADGFYQALGYFLAVGWIWIAFRGGREAYQHYRSRFKAFLLILAVSLGLAFLSRTNLGTHVEDADPVMGGGDVVTDYEPTDAQRNKAATLTFLLSFLPAFVSLLGRNESMRRQQESGTENSG
jgi:drug/metabolite transporter (DMT)-like permease